MMAEEEEEGLKEEEEEEEEKNLSVIVSYSHSDLPAISQSFFRPRVKY